MNSGTAESLGDVLGSVAEGTQSRYRDFENDLVGLVMMLAYDIFVCLTLYRSAWCTEKLNQA